MESLQGNGIIIKSRESNGKATEMEVKLSSGVLYSGMGASVTEKIDAFPPFLVTGVESGFVLFRRPSPHSSDAIQQQVPGVHWNPDRVTPHRSALHCIASHRGKSTDNRVCVASLTYRRFDTPARLAAGLPSLIHPHPRCYN